MINLQKSGCLPDRETPAFIYNIINVAIFFVQNGEKSKNRGRESEKTGVFKEKKYKNSHFLYYVHKITKEIMKKFCKNDEQKVLAIRTNMVYNDRA